MNYYFNAENILNLKNIAQFEQCRIENISIFNKEYTNLELVGRSSYITYKTIIKNSIFKNYCEVDDLKGCLVPALTNLSFEIRNKAEKINCIILFPLDEQKKFADDKKCLKEKFYPTEIEFRKITSHTNNYHFCTDFISEFYYAKEDEILTFEFLKYEYKKFDKLDYLELKLKSKIEEKILRILIDDYHVYSFPGMIDIKVQTEINIPGQDFKKFYEEITASHKKIKIFMEKESKPLYAKNKRNKWDDNEFWQDDVEKEIEPNTNKWIKKNSSFVFDFKHKYSFETFSHIDFTDKFIYSFFTEEELAEKKKDLVNNEDYESLKGLEDKK